MTHARDWVDILQALLAPAIALVAVGIAFAQWWTARNKLRLEMFDRRWAVYMAVRDMLAIISLRGITTQEDEIIFSEGVRGTRWLLNERIGDYVEEEIPSRLGMLKLANTTLATGSGEQERDGAERSQSAQRVWAREQYAVVDEMFAPFLTVREQFSEFLWWTW